MTPRSEMHAASYVFGSAGVVNQTGGWNTGLAFLFGLLSVQWTVRKETISLPQHESKLFIHLLADDSKSSKD